MQVWIELAFLIYFSYVAAYSFIFSFAGLFYRTPSFLSAKVENKNRIAVFIPSYKEDTVIINVARQALKQSYAKSKYGVIVIADSLKKETLEELRTLDIIVHEVHFEQSTKVKSLKSVLNTYTGYDIAVILDADNVMHPDFLEKIDACYSQGWRAIQGQRTAKNANTSFAVLDGLSETIANHINREGSIALGLSSPIIGSGMAFDFKLLKDIMNTIDSVGGFDKELQLKILAGQDKIHYLKNAIVLDEKVDNPEVFKNQRKRWMSSHFIYFKKFFLLGITSLFKGNLSIFNIAILYNLQLSRMMNLGLFTVVTLISLLLNDLLYFPFWYWSALFGIYILSFLFAIPTSFYNKALLQALLHAPKAFLTIFLIHFKLKGADKKFIHTPHKQQ
jgi:cellulose synthase/poly-beta-1,6-N-acetylglucosamine synthase-like glycosyltransferase